MNIILYLTEIKMISSSEKTKDYRGDVYSIKQASPHRYAAYSRRSWKAAIAISINLRTGCKGRHEIVFSYKGKAGGTRYSGLVAQISRRGIISEG